MSPGRIPIRLESIDQLHTLLFDVISDGVLIVDERGFIMDCNTSFHQKLGYARDEIIGMNVKELDDPEYAAMVPERMQKIRTEGEAIFETAHRRKDGSIMPVELNARQVQIGEQSIFLSIVRDITEAKLAEDELLRAKNQLSNLFEHAPDGIFIADLDGHYTDVNEAGCMMLGYARDELIGMSITDLIRPEELPRLEASRANQLNGAAETSEWELRRKDGTYLPVEVSAKILDDNRWQGFVRDISIRKQMDAKLHEKDLMYRALVEASADGFWACDLQGRIIEVNEAYARRSGYSREELLGMSIPELEANELPEDTREHIKKVIREGSDRFETRHKTKSGEAWPVEIFASYWPQKGGIIMVFNTDISERKKAQSELNKLSQALKQASDGVIITDPDGIIEYANPAFEKITGYTADEAVGQPVSILKSEAQDREVYQELWETISRGKPWERTLIDRKKDGSFYPALVSIAPIFDNGEIAHYVSIHKDMTEHRRLEHQLIQSQKMESMGTLVGGIAHDFNNMLASVQGNVFLALREMENPELLKERLETVDQVTEKAALIVRQLLTFAKKDMVEMEAVSLNHLIMEGFKLAKTTIPENITHHLDICSDDLVVNADVTQLQQAIINLSNNARDALEEVADPVIEWQLSRYDADETFYNKHPRARQQQYARITVRDNGHGINPNHLQSIFDPFFTTKDTDKGTGLGLAMVYGSIQRHQGFIEVESTAGKGTAFHIYLPLLHAHITDSEKPAKPTFRGDGETILLVEDVESLRKVSTEVLKKMGYHVLPVPNGEAALATYRDQPERIDIILSDVVMPGLGGVELAQEIRRQNKTIPIILATGYDKDQAMHGRVFIENCQVLSKPYTYDMLSQLIRGMLSRRNESTCESEEPS